MKDEVEEFLKRVAQMRAQAEAQARAQQQRLVPATPPQNPPPAGRQPLQQAPSHPRRHTTYPPPTDRQPLQQAPGVDVVYLQPAEAEVVDAELAETANSVARHVEQHLRGPQEIAEHTKSLGAEVDRADDKLEAHLHQVFDHQVGHLKKSATDTAAPAASDAARTGFTAGSIVDMLLSTDHIRNAIILGEILRRPDERA